jgi:hypothetical protein
MAIGAAVAALPCQVAAQTHTPDEVSNPALTGLEEVVVSATKGESYSANNSQLNPVRRPDEF